MTEINGIIHRVKVPTPFPVGDVNCYLIDGDPVTLVDVGPKTDESLGTLRAGIRQAGHEVRDVEQIVLTHGHVDHMGLAAQVLRETEGSAKGRASVVVHSEDLVRVADYVGFTKQRMSSYVKIMKYSGVPPSEMPRISEKMLAKYFTGLGESVPEARGLQDGDTVRTGIGDLEVLWVPGHSQGSICLVSKRNRVVFSGDHVLLGISSNPSMDFDVTTEIPMVTHTKSLERMRPLKGYTVLPGHREQITDLASRLDELADEYRRKLDKAQQLLSSSPKSVYEISRIIYGNYDAQSMVLALAECHDLLSILERSGLAVLETESGLVCAKTPGR